MSLIKNNFIINSVIDFLKKIKLKSLYGFSLYELFNLYFIGIIKGAISTRASSISFSFFMAFFPFVLFVLNLIPFFPIDNFDEVFLSLLESLLPNESAIFFHDIFVDINSNKRSGLLSTTLIFSIILIGNGVNAVFGGFTDSYHVQFSRNLFKQYLYAILVGFILVIVVLFATVSSIFFDFLITQNNSLVSFMFIYLKYIFLILISLISFSSLYYFGTIQGKNLKFISPGSIMTTILLFLSTYFFGLYIDNFSNYNELYGSIGALIIMMLYIWINSISLLLGFELNVVIYKLKNY
ncbi:MAG: YihY/virulence factor BrkB family protein [Flavobacteriaceae bacterium]|jgi:membrane protein|nr:YihY/virulence factor BrkB family protein [Flavobacteriaceae bacterium]MBT3754268.1 YihY/virulence factor BrkB family protein [Flavobacteriaceae bacterium]MBT3793831.1 YihY/virulence factor BrkB family protein [Flavobacteriaceae bacterium]MBT4063344.1 YihY/virulence factor BrkB family protein [Flavobacteriaceae bacterium]MBT4246688.1 YihY/virulence factor BrkB family protein [Flavobacteriaceae bacterium]